MVQNSSKRKLVKKQTKTITTGPQQFLQMSEPRNTANVNEYKNSRPPSSKASAVYKRRISEVIRESAEFRIEEKRAPATHEFSSVMANLFAQLQAPSN